MSRPISAESVFRALAHPTRRLILQMLDRGEMAAGEIAENFRHSQPAVSRHLRVLHVSGVVQMRRRGAERWYRLPPNALQQVYRWLEGLRTQSRPPMR